MSLSAQVGVRRGMLHVELDVEVAAGEVLAMLGPNGAGKSTLMRTLATLQEADSGSAFLGDMKGQIFAMFVLTVAAAEAAIGLAILVIFFRRRGTIAVDAADQMRG